VRLYSQLVPSPVSGYPLFPPRRPLLNSGRNRNHNDNKKKEKKKKLGERKKQMFKINTTLINKKKKRKSWKICPNRKREREKRVERAAGRRRL
jgi:hypothetical protein